MRPDQVLLGEADRSHKIWLWPGYGVVCPTLVTTNGSARILLQSWARPVTLTPAGIGYFVGIGIYAAGRSSQR